MGHAIHGFIASEPDLRRAAEGLPFAVVVPLGAGLAFLPVTEEVGPGEEMQGSLSLLSLTERLEEWAAEQSRVFPITYIVTFYFGGNGWQEAALWEDGKVTAARSGEGSINLVLQRLGVVRGDKDEFDTVGLGDHRTNEAWLDGRR